MENLKNKNKEIFLDIDKKEKLILSKINKLDIMMLQEKDIIEFIR